MTDYPTLKPGQAITLVIQKNKRPGVVLAVLNGRYLVEYELPYKTTSLVFFEKFYIYRDNDTIRPQLIYNTYGYDHMPLKWLREIHKNGLEWQGNSQRGKAFSVADLLENYDSRRQEIDYNETHAWEEQGQNIVLKRTRHMWNIHINGFLVGTLNKRFIPKDLAKSVANLAANAISEKKDN